ncbi:HSP20-like chaperone [Immersiella caudata]|uniref:HSP20-like chaperone n=1 Tax=Immersiella caudata TaxID=314043 RepID=A0AA40BWX0_9PEZI|nr:HSP20-like chaperone [Immersiella caudata]
MLSFLSSPYCAAPAPEPSFITLFRLLDDFDSYSREAQAPQPQPQQQRRHIRRTITTTFKPKFDVRETANAYELHGELPGIDKQNLNIEFTDPQTIVVRGRVERTYESKPEAEEQATTTEPEAAPAAEEKVSDADETASNASSHGWHHATVEDDPEEPATPPGAATPAETETPKAEVTKPVAPAVKQAPAPAEPKEKVWLYERSIGQFSRTFAFPTRVEHENVSASLDNGVLSIVVPKAPKHQLRRVAIF